MRDITRIPKFMKVLEDNWNRKCPDLRFGQIVCCVNVNIIKDGKDPFYIEEEEMMKYFQQFFDSITKID